MLKIKIFLNVSKDSHIFLLKKLFSENNISGKFNVYTNDIIRIQVTKIVHISRKKMILLSAQCHIPPSHQSLLKKNKNKKVLQMVSKPFCPP